MSTFGLCPIQRDLALRQQGLGAVRILTVNRHTDAETDIKIVTIDRKRFADGGNEPVRQGTDFGGIVNIAQQIENSSPPKRATFS